MEYGCCTISPCLFQLFRQKVRLESRLSLMLELHTLFWQAADGLRFRLSNQSQFVLYKMMVQPRTPLLLYFMRPFYPPGFSTIMDNQKLAGQHGRYCNLVICPTDFRGCIQRFSLMSRLSSGTVQEGTWFLETSRRNVHFPTCRTRKENVVAVQCPFF